ncbi:MipA/OmpV family protein [Granulosicoccus sp. 3-233]|uniref:MipA/OmpV family protein n=1 Tax=Granulosicoccus sp. 3-233 TaxID=3417969 RepID=UPI003D34135E
MTLPILMLMLCLAGGGVAHASATPLDGDGSQATMSDAGHTADGTPDPVAAADAIPETASTVQRRPVWEFGIGGGYFSGFDYPASSDSNRRGIALPFFVYRGPQWRFGGGGIRAVAIEQPRIKLDLSMGGSLNANSQGNSAREGMPDLDFLFEIGPQLEVGLLDRTMPSGGRVQLRFSAELRAVMSTDFRRMDGRGVVLEAGFGVNYRNFRQSGIDLLAALQSTYASERLQDYFYEVAPVHATEARPRFDAQGGYLESGLFAGIGLTPHRNLRLFMGVFSGWFDGARNEDSPLFETETSTGFAVGLVWTLKKSRRMVDVVELGSNS